MSLRCFRVALKRLAHAEAIATQAAEAALFACADPHKAIIALRVAKTQCKRLHRARRRVQMQSGLHVAAKAYLAVSPHH